MIPPVSPTSRNENLILRQKELNAQCISKYRDKANVRHGNKKQEALLQGQPLAKRRKVRNVQ
jgi:hypothetical protein